jgi:hypothetical protein
LGLCGFFVHITFACLYNSSSEEPTTSENGVYVKIKQPQSKTPFTTSYFSVENTLHIITQHVSAVPQPSAGVRDRQ